MRKLLWPVLAILSGCGASPQAPSVVPIALAAQDGGTAAAEGRKKKPRPSPSPAVGPPVLNLYERARTCPPGIPVPEEPYLRHGCMVTVVCETRWDTGNRDFQLRITQNRGFIELWRLFEYENRLVGELTAGSAQTPHVLQVTCSQGPFMLSRDWIVLQ